MKNDHEYYLLVRSAANNTSAQALTEIISVTEANRISRMSQSFGSDRFGVTTPESS